MGLAGCILVLSGVCNIGQVHNFCFSLVLLAFIFAVDVPPTDVHSRCCWCCALLMWTPLLITLQDLCGVQ